MPDYGMNMSAQEAVTIVNLQTQIKIVLAASLVVVIVGAAPIPVLMGPSPAPTPTVTPVTPPILGAWSFIAAVMVYTVES